jgi:hypothetical protein
MTAKLIEREGYRLLVADAEGPILRRTQDLLDLIIEAMAQKATMLVVPAPRLDPAFFQLRSGLAGEFVQKIVNYRFKLAVIGDISTHTAASGALRDFVRESNQGRSVFFLPDLDAAEEKLAALSAIEQES